MLPQVTLSGNLVAPPELKFLANGTAIAKLRTASNERIRQDDGTFVDGSTTFLDVVVFGRKAEACAELTKGQPVMVSGTLVQRTWENEAGEKRTSFEVKASEIAAVVRVAGRAPTGDHGQEEQPPF